MPERPGARRSGCVGWLLVGCVLLVIGWELMIAHNRSVQTTFTLTRSAIGRFLPVCPGWQVVEIPIQEDPQEPNIISFRMDPRGGANGNSPAPTVSRLVHGYNMHDCMVEKGYRVALLQETLRSRDSNNWVQVWRLTSDIGDSSIWVTSMLRPQDFKMTDLDVRSMPFPKISPLDDRSYSPTGLSWRSLRNPVQNLKRFFHRKWSDARGDWLTLLGLKPAAGASGEVLTLVTAWKGALSPSTNQQVEVTAMVLDAHGKVQRELVRWREQNPAVPVPPS
jgi:hypothetical protein